MAMYNKSKFNFSETFNNSDGKTSGSGFVGVITGILTAAAFAVAMVGWWLGKPDILDIFDKILQLGLLSAALLGVRKVSGVFNKGKMDVGGPEPGSDDPLKQNIDKQPG
jgi:hypothetical protein